ncbi:MAG TPA: hypothetical protein DCL86_08920, partial [Bacteroidales bacterium]|nr:hypothetical protein [Bacteroidales bacterium]
MKIIYYPFLILCLTLLGIPVTAQQSAKITIDLKGLNDSLVYLASYGGDKQFVVDTAVRTENGSYVFRPGKLLDHGMYIFVDASKKRLFDFIIGQEQTFL